MILSKLEGLPNTSLYVDWHNKAFLTFINPFSPISILDGNVLLTILI
jgi:hypothetical protein